MAKAITQALLLVIIIPVVSFTQAPTTLNDFFLPGSQPNQSGNIESPDKCDNCHGGYDQTVEPAFNWRGSMMAQAARDPLFYACMAIANQDAPESGDLCIRCHSPDGWLAGRSEPTDGSALNNNDRQGVQCDFCHKTLKPADQGTNPYPNDTLYTDNTYLADSAYLAILSHIPPTSANGMYVADASNSKRGPYFETAARHQTYYSPFHSESAICGTCHDVSNPALSRQPDGTYWPNSFDSAAPSFDLRTMFPIERTYSEWLASAYNSPTGVYAPQFGGNKDSVSSCQDCHMRDVSGYGADKADVPHRDDLPLHDMTGGNTFIPLIINSVFPGEASQEALDSGIVRARSMLQKAATMELTSSVGVSNHELNVRIINETGHKLPSGYPEGRRIWINVRAFNNVGDLVYESGAYDSASGVLTHDLDAKIYEIKPGISESLAPVVNRPAGVGFHFVLNNEIFSDNRIPPRGFTNVAFEEIQSPPVAYEYEDGQYWDDTEYELPGAAALVEVRLYYQTTSKEYVEFLRDANYTDSTGQVFYDLWANNGKAYPETMVFDTLHLTPLTGNNDPVLSPIGDQTVSEGQLLVVLVQATDPDGTVPQLSTGALPDGATFTDSLDGTGIFEWTPGYDQSGGYGVTFYATDDSLAVDSAVVTITVTQTNLPPVLDSVGSHEVAEGNQLLLTITASDPDGTIPSITLNPLPTGATFEDNGDGSATFDWLPGFDQAGEHVVTFYAMDDSSAVDFEVVTISVTETNRPPVLDSIGDQTVAEGDQLLLTMTASDPDGTIPVIAIDPLPAGAAFEDHSDGTATFDWTPAMDQQGEHVVMFYATDDASAVDSQEVTITVTETNQPPVLDSINNTAVAEGSQLLLTITASDPDGTMPAIAIDPLPAGATFEDHNDGTATFDWTPAFDQAGDHPVLFTASDGSLIDSQSVIITVTNTNRGPVLDPIGDKSATAGELLSFDIYASDPDGDSVRLSCTGLPDGAVFDEHGWDDGAQKYRASFGWTPLESDSGLFGGVRFAANDGLIESEETISITVTVVSHGCCGLYTGGLTGNTNCGTDGKLTLSDITRLIDFVYISKEPLCCHASGNVNGSEDCKITLSDISGLIDAVYISKSPTQPCIPECEQ